MNQIMDDEHARNLIENDAELNEEGIKNDPEVEHEIDEIEIPGKLVKKGNKYINFNDPNNGELVINYIAHDDVVGDGNDNDTDDNDVEDDDIPAAAYSDFTNEQTEDNENQEIEISEGNEGMMDYDFDDNNDNMDNDEIENENENEIENENENENENEIEEEDEDDKDTNSDKE